MRSEKGFAHIILLLFLLIGLAVTVYLVSQKTNLFSHASTSPIVFKSLDGKLLPLNNNGIPQTSASAVIVELTSPLGPPVKISGPISGPNQKGTVSFKVAFNPADFDRSAVRPYDSEPVVFTSFFNDNINKPGINFFWVEFKDSTGKIDRRSAQIEIVGSLNGFGKALKFNNETSNNAYAVITPINQTSVAPTNWTFEGWIKIPKPVSGNYLRDYTLATYNKSKMLYDDGYLFRMNLETQESNGNSRPMFQALIANSNSAVNSNYISVGGGNNTPIKADTWNHIAVTGSAQGDACTLKLYINGVLADTSQKYNPQCKFSLDQARDIWIAKPPTVLGGISGYYFPGAIDEVRFSAKLQYTGNFTPPTTPFLPVGNDSSIIAQYHFDGNVEDSGWYHHKTQTFGNVSYIDSTIGKTSPTVTVAPTSIPAVRSLKVTSPNGGEALQKGSTYRIKWDSNKIDKVMIGYSTGPGSLNWITNSGPIANQGYYDWVVNVGNTTNTKFKIDITGYETGKGSVNDQSDDFFTVGVVPSGATLKVVPNSCTLSIGQTSCTVKATFNSSNVAPGAVLCLDGATPITNNQGRQNTDVSADVKLVVGTHTLSVRNMVASGNSLCTDKPGYGQTVLASSTVPVVLATPTPKPFVCTPCAADINGNGKVDIYDYMILISCGGLKPTDSRFGISCAKADINGNGKVDQPDRSCLQTVYSKSCKK